MPVHSKTTIPYFSTISFLNVGFYFATESLLLKFPISESSSEGWKLSLDSKVCINILFSRS